MLMNYIEIDTIFFISYVTIEVVCVNTENLNILVNYPAIYSSITENDL